MSSVNSASNHLQVPADYSNPPDFVALAASLQEAAQSLFACASQEPANPTVKPSANREEGEIRSFYFPQSAVHMERELLRKYRATDFQGLLEEVYTLRSAWSNSCRAFTRMCA